ncbi:MAG: hypothetical protein ABFC89_05910 [Methanospirillum sp.]
MRVRDNENLEVIEVSEDVARAVEKRLAAPGLADWMFRKGYWMMKRD